jgi:hypothetical protein
MKHIMKERRRWLRKAAALGVVKTVADFRTGPVQKLVRLALLLASFQSPALAANHYIRAEAAGANNGTSWANAWRNFASVTWTRGDTYYVAGGRYAENVTVTKALSGTNWITVRKANATDNASDLGWDPSYASAGAVIQGALAVSVGYIEVDGVTGTGTNGHGIKIDHSASTGSVIWCSAGGSYYYLHHLEAVGYGCNSSSNGFTVIYYPYTLATQTKGLHVANCWLHEVTLHGVACGSIVGTSYGDYGMLVESNVISEVAKCWDVNQHGQGLQIGYNSEDGFTVIRDNIFRNIDSQGPISFLGGYYTNGFHHDALIYNNVFHITDPVTYVPGDVVYFHPSSMLVSNVSFCNNTIYNFPTPGGGFFRNDCTNSVNVSFINNIVEDCFIPWHGHHNITTNSNNGYYNNTGAGADWARTNQVNPVTGYATAFVNAAGDDFSLVSGGYAVSSGLSLNDLFTTDASGKLRGRSWDLGPFQRTAAPAPPQNPRIDALGP